MLRSPWLLRLARLALLGLLLWMIGAGWHAHGIPGVETPDPLMYTHATTHLFWVSWMMGVSLIAVIAGRLWCGICPLGWLCELATRLGLRLELPAWLRSAVPAALSLLLLQLIVFAYSVHRFPDYSARLLAAILLLSLGAGLLFRGRAFCRIFCPAGALFGLYARLSPLRLARRAAAPCQRCETKACSSEDPCWKELRLGQASLRWPSRGPGCPAQLQPGAGSLSDCHLCLGCLQRCTSRNLSLIAEPPLKRGDSAVTDASCAFFYLVVVGLLTVNFSKVFPQLRELLLWAPLRLAQAAGAGDGAFYLLATFWVGLILPLLLFLPGTLLLKIDSLGFRNLPADEPLRADSPGAPQLPPGYFSRLGRLVLPTLPLVMGAHLVLALVKLNAKASYLPYVLGEPAGMRSYLAFNVLNLAQAPGLILPLDVIKWILAAVLIVAYALGLCIARRQGSRHPHPRTFFAASLISASLLAALYGATLIRWLFIR